MEPDKTQPTKTDTQYLDVTKLDSARDVSVAPIESVRVAPQATADKPVPPPPVMSSEPTTTVIEEVDNKVQPINKPKQNILPIIIAIVVAITLIVLAVFASQRDKASVTPPASTTTQTESSANTSDTPTAADADDTNAAANDALTNDDSAGTTESEIDDTSLGL